MFLSWISTCSSLPCIWEPVLDSGHAARQLLLVPVLLVTLTMCREVLRGKFTVVSMVFLLLPSLHRVNTRTLSSMLTNFLFLTKTEGLLQKVMFLPFLPNFEALPPPADRSNRETDENNELAAVWWVFNVKTSFNFDFRQKRYNQFKKGYNFRSAPILFATVLCNVFSVQGCAPGKHLALLFFVGWIVNIPSLL